MAEPARVQGDRLPWLTEVPRTAPPPPVPKRKRQLPWLAFLLGGLFALIGVGAYWLGARQGEEDRLDAERPGMAAQEEHAPPPVPTQTETNAAEAALAEAPPPASVREPDRSEQRRLAEERRREQARREARVRRAQPKVVKEAAPPAPAIPLQPVVRGRIIQTGAFPSRAQAEADWQRLVKRWPYLATKPRLISPIEVRSTDGRATRMYRVQLATASQAQSVVICQQLEKARQSCVVVY